MNRSAWLKTLIIAVVMGAVLAQAQRGFRRGMIDPSDRRGVPTWEISKDLGQDVFTFVRIQYSGPYGRGFGGRGRFGRGGSWAIDYPDADLNISYRLHQMTSMQVHPEGLVLELTDPRLFNYPFIHINPGNPIRVEFSDEESKILRKYLLNGGFLFATDFWGVADWQDLHSQMKAVFPDREPIDLPLEHPIFHCVFDLKQKPQVPSIEVAMWGRDQGITWERPDAKEPHFWAYFDDKNRMVALLCHNTDLTDGWEREGDNEWYFHEFAEKKAYPMGINIVSYVLTH